eukprot:CAMPEP_0181307602 /NCGR_PEP_ID=MMETSP1101-20121128/10979_1 /TAXON_ID=46948 /ORGANISM="Rhodomonas abbreviata, Strain Caron Lab Isolate" /LENGTH=213 /DNA_ID=CAMNT_0023413853 /DNA_START=195 /DNA_END=836 /DNA_ORIENTATION=+
MEINMLLDLDERDDVSFGVNLDGEWASPMNDGGEVAREDLSANRRENSSIADSRVQHPHSDMIHASSSPGSLNDFLDWASPSGNNRSRESREGNRGAGGSGALNEEWVDLTQDDEPVDQPAQSQASGRREKREKRKGQAVVTEQTPRPEAKAGLPQMVECTICLDPVTKPSLTKCGHVFCHDCVVPWIHKQKICPQCRRKAAVRDLRLIYALR